MDKGIDYKKLYLLADDTVNRLIDMFKGRIYLDAQDIYEINKIDNEYRNEVSEIIKERIVDVEVDNG